MTNTENKLPDAFIKGWEQVQQKDVEKVKAEVLEALHLTSNGSFHYRLKGNVEPKGTERVAIEAVFAKYGITEIWGE